MAFNKGKNVNFRSFALTYINTSIMKKLLIVAFILCVSAVQMLAQANLSDYTGTFKLSENPYSSTVKVTIQDNKLIAAPENLPVSELTPSKNPDEFNLEAMGATVTFVRSAGTVIGVKIEAQGQVVTGQKEGSTSSLADYVASFRMADNEYVKKIVIAMKDGQLALSSDANPAEGAVLKAGSVKDTFSATIQGYDADVIFSRAAGKITAIKLSVAGGQVVLIGDRE